MTPTSRLYRCSLQIREWSPFYKLLFKCDLAVWLMVSWHHPKSCWPNLNVLLCSSQHFLLSSPQPTLMSLECKLKSLISRHVPLPKMSTSLWRMLMIINRWCTWCHLRLSAAVISCVPPLRSGLMDMYLLTRTSMVLAWYVFGAFHF